MVLSYLYLDGIAEVIPLPSLMLKLTVLSRLPHAECEPGAKHIIFLFYFYSQDHNA